MKTISVEIEDVLCAAYEHFSEENKRHFSEYANRILRKLVNKDRVAKLQESLGKEDIKVAGIDADILYSIIREEEY